MELHHLRCAVAIADSGSFSAAAEALHISQPTLSYAIAQLERSVGARLFERSARGSALTAAGEAFVPLARQTLGNADEAKAAVHSLTGKLVGALRVIGIRTAVVETATYVARFHELHPDVRISVATPDDDHGVADQVRTGRADVGIMRSNSAPLTLASTEVDSQGIVVVFPPPRGKRRPARGFTLAHLESAPLIVPTAGTWARSAHDGLLRAHGVEPTIGAECSHTETVIELVRGGVGAWITSDSRAANLAREGFEVRSTSGDQGPLCVIRRTPATSPIIEAFAQVAQAARSAT